MDHLVVSQKLAIMRMMRMMVRQQLTVMMAVRMKSLVRQQLTVMMVVVVVEVLASNGLIHGLGLEAGGRGTALHLKVKKS
jgi:hypothetical protein